MDPHKIELNSMKIRFLSDIQFGFNVVSLGTASCCRECQKIKQRKSEFSYRKKIKVLSTVIFVD